MKVYNNKVFFFMRSILLIKSCIQMRFFLFFILVVSNVTYGQVELLDSNNGFKSIKFGTKPYEIDGIRFYGSDDSYNLYFLLEEKTDLNQVFDVDFPILMLGYDIYTDKLKLIKYEKFYKGTSTKIANVALQDYKNIVSKFERVLGKSDFRKNKDEDMPKLQHLWYTKKNSLLVVFEQLDYDINKLGELVGIFTIKVLFRNIEVESNSE